MSEHSEYMRKWRLANPEKVKQYYETRKQKPRSNRNKREDHLKHRYNLTESEWEAKFDAQNRMCESCSATELHGRSKQWQTDHNHKTTAVRGIICSRCNRLIGQLGDTAEAVASQLTIYLKYLQKYDGKLSDGFKQQIVNAILNDEIVNVPEADPDRAPKPRHS